MNEENKENLNSENQDSNGDGAANPTETKTSDVDTEALKAQVETERKKFEDQRRRAEKREKRLEEVEEELKKFKSAKPETQPNESKSEPVSGLSREEAILIAKGLSVEEVEKAKKIALIEGIDPIKAVESDYFKTWKSEEDKKREISNTQLPASHGSAKSKPKIDFNTPGLTPEQHKELWKAKMGK